MNATWVKLLFGAVGVYDAVLGLAFLVAGNAVFEKFGVAPPGHIAYVQFPALLLLVFAVMFFRVAANPPARRELMLYGVGLKVAYCATVFGHHLTTGVPSMWLPWAWADLLTIVLFLIAFFVTKPATAAS